MLKNINKLDWGLCGLAWLLYYYNNSITIGEYKLIIRYIDNNRPNNLYKKRDNAYYWKAGLSKPRIAWLKKHIEKQQ